MRLDFRILWIDDQPRHVKSFKEGIERHLRNLGFELEVQEISSLDQIDDIVEQHIHDDGIDLVLVDYDLGSGGEGGQEALRKIRQSFPYKDIIFYSAADTDKLREIAYGAKIDGVHFATRMTLSDDTSRYIDNMLRKVMDIDHMRGVVMSATSDIDWLVERTLEAIHEKLPPDESEQTIKEMGEAIEKKLESSKADLKKALDKGGIAPLMKSKYLVTAYDKLGYLVKAMTTLAERSDNTVVELATVYMHEVVPRRNKLAHVVCKRTNGKQVLEGPDGYFSQEDMTQLRCDLVKHRKNFSDVAVIYDVPLE